MQRDTVRPVTSADRSNDITGVHFFVRAYDLDGTIFTTRKTIALVERLLVSSRVRVSIPQYEILHCYGRDTRLSLLAIVGN